ncbi:MAG: adenylate/guanylate cyclase domain-containing protein [Bryobacteraceae bacterium]
MALLSDVFKDAKSRVRKTVLAIDVVSSTAMKEKEPEASWLNTFAWFYDLTAATVKAHEGVVVKFIGDGAMAAFSEDQAANGINCAIALQEQIAGANAVRTVTLNCCIGIATGDVREFDVGDQEGNKDYLGNVVDRAFRLCSAANAKAILVDKATVDAAPMHRVKCRVGESTAVKRTTEEYLGSLEAIPLKGFAQPIQYHEVLWENNRYGLNPKYVTHSPQVETPRIEPPLHKRTQWQKGSVTTINTTFGFIHSEGEDFWFNQDRLLNHHAVPKVRDAVWFVPREPMPNAKNRQAMNVVPLGSKLTGTLTTVNPNNYGFAACSPNAYGEQQNIFVYLEDSANWTKGSEIVFVVGENEKGPAGMDPRPSNDDPE